MKKFKRSKITYVCYAIAIVAFAYCILLAINTMNTIVEYYASYDMSPAFGETAGYLLQSCLPTLTSAVLLFMAGLILDEVRKNNPAYWVEAAGTAGKAKVSGKIKKEADSLFEDNDNVDRIEFDEDGNAIIGQAAASAAVFSAEVAEPDEEVVADEEEEAVVEAAEEIEEAEEVAAEETAEEVVEVAEEEIEVVKKEVEDKSHISDALRSAYEANSTATSEDGTVDFVK